MSINLKRNLIKIGLMAIAAWLLLGVFALSQTWLLKKDLQELNLAKANQRARLVLPIAQTYNLITLKQIPAVKTWKLSLQVVKEAGSWQQELPEIDQVLTAQDQLLVSDQLAAASSQLSPKLDQLKKSLNQCRICSKFLSYEQLQLTNQTLDSSQAFLAWLPELQSGQHQIIVWLQNSQEIRATGGFVGTIGLLEIKNNYWQNPVFLDIYDLAGQTETQLTDFTQMAQYLGQQKAMSITDANWHPDFEESVNNWLSFLPPENANLPIKKEKVDLVTAVNLELIENWLEVLGPIELSDFNQVITATNLAQAARQNRLEFFAGDNQKKQFLSLVFNQLQIKLTQANQTEINQLAKTSLNSLRLHQIQLASPRQTLKPLNHHPWLAQHLNPNQANYLLYIVESNVGINKANSRVERQIQIDIQPELVTVEVSFDNKNLPLDPIIKEKIKQNSDLLQAPHLQYINYLRLITNSSFQLTESFCDSAGNSKPTIDQISKNKTSWLQLGLLSTTAEQSQSGCRFVLTPASLLKPSDSWVILKQPGLPPTPYQINFFNQDYQLTLKADQHLPIKQL